MNSENIKVKVPVLFSNDLDEIEEEIAVFKIGDITSFHSGKDNITKVYLKKRK